MAEQKASVRQVERILMFAQMARACVPELCEQTSDKRTCIPHQLSRAEADRMIDTLKEKARRTEHARQT